ncbi:tetratricopeptide repeat protein [Oscillatoria amoena NRMC-F 0135]|nr:tetratricopeptide repeat protein [Oscillatoria amoena NRMC-F 0135]
MKYFAGMPYPKYAMLLLAVITLAVTGRAQSAQDVDSLEAVYRRLPDDTVKAKTLYDLAFTLVQSNPEAAMQKTHELMRLSVKINFPKGRAMALDVQGNIYRMQGKYMDAVSRHFEALHIYDSLGFRNGYRNVLVNTGSDYTYLKNYPKAIEFF